MECVFLVVNYSIICLVVVEPCRGNLNLHLQSIHGIALVTFKVFSDYLIVFIQYYTDNGSEHSPLSNLAVIA